MFLYEVGSYQKCLHCDNKIKYLLKTAVFYDNSEIWVTNNNHYFNFLTTEAQNCNLNACKCWMITYLILGNPELIMILLINQSLNPVFSIVQVISLCIINLQLSWMKSHQSRQRNISTATFVTTKALIPTSGLDVDTESLTTQSHSSSCTPINNMNHWILVKIIV